MDFAHFIGGHAGHLLGSGPAHCQRDGLVPLGIVDHGMADTVDDAGQKLAICMRCELAEFHVIPRASKPLILSSE